MPAWDGKKTGKPTTFMMRTKFADIIVVRTGNRRVLARPLNTFQTRYMRGLGISQSEFLSPRGGPA